MGTPVRPQQTQQKQLPSRGGGDYFDDEEGEEGLSRFGRLESSATSSPAATPRQQQQRHILFEEEEEEAESPLMTSQQQQQMQQQCGMGEEDAPYEFELAAVKPGESFSFFCLRV